MRMRILATLGGGISGLLLAYALPVDAALGLSPLLAEITCTLVGLVVGYLGTFLLDVFLTSSD